MSGCVRGSGGRDGGVGGDNGGCAVIGGDGGEGLWCFMSWCE